MTRIIIAVVALSLALSAPLRAAMVDRSGQTDQTEEARRQDEAERKQEENERLQEEQERKQDEAERKQDEIERKQDAAQAQKEKAEERAEHEEELYDQGTESLDDHEWRQAAKSFKDASRMQLSHADAALYWLAYSYGKLGLRTEALDTVLELRKSYPHSRWIEDSKALEVEIRQSSGQQIQPEHAGGDDELKLMALTGLMSTDPERALPTLEAILASVKNTIKIKDRALFVLSQSPSPRALDVLSRVARNDGARDLQSRAVRYLGIMGGENGRKVLAEVYSSTKDLSVRKSVLRSYMIAGDRARLLTAARGETNDELRSDAVTQLGVMGARNELAELYTSEQSVDVRKKIIQAMFIGGNAEKLSEIARSEKVLELRLAAIRNLGLLGGTQGSQALISIYESDPRPEIRKGIIRSLFIQGNSGALITLARKEKDPAMKKEIVSNLSLMGSKDATDYLMDFLKE